MAAIVKMDDKAIHGLYDLYLTRMQIACTENIKFLKNTSEGMTAEEAARLAYTNPAFETPYKKVLDAQQFFVLLRDYCIQKSITNESIKIRKQEEFDKAELLSEMLADYLRERCMQSVLPNQANKSEDNNEKQKQLEILESVIKERIYNINEQIRRNNVMIAKLQTEINELNKEADNKFATIKQMISASFTNEIILDKKYELTVGDDKNVSALTIDANKIKDLFHEKIIDNIDKRKDKYADLSEVAQNYAKQLFMDRYSNLPESDKVRIVEMNVKENATVLSDITNDIVDKIQIALSPVIDVKIEELNQTRSQINEKSEEINKYELINENLISEKDGLMEKLKEINPDISDKEINKEFDKEAAALDDLFADFLQEDQPAITEEKQPISRSTEADRYRKIDHHAKMFTEKKTVGADKTQAEQSEKQLEDTSENNHKFTP